ncbi:MAG: lysylphosphatidylglycerol synthase domain-containing protein [Planctomycetota bacterium]
MPSEQPNHPARKWAITAAKAVVAALVVAFVAGSVVDAARQLASQRVRPSIAWLLLAGGLYVVGLLPMAWFWQRALAALSQPSRWRDLLPAYFLGHLGKYVPGKALVVVLRTAAVRRTGGDSAPIAASVFVETLTMMAVGGVVASLLVAWLRPVGAGPWMGPLAAGLAVVAAAPTLPPVMRLLLRRFAKAEPNAFAASLTWRLLGAGWLAAGVTWLGLGASVWAVVRSLSPELAFTSETLLAALLAACLPVVAGFLSLLPGGLVVRDGLMFTLLRAAPGVDEPTALAATVLARLVWIASEGAACGMLMLPGVRRRDG